MARDSWLLPDLGCVLKAPGRRGRRGLSDCAGLLVGLTFPLSSAPDYNYLLAVDDRRQEAGSS